MLYDLDSGRDKDLSGLEETMGGRVSNSMLGFTVPLLSLPPQPLHIDDNSQASSTFYNTNNP